MYIGKSQELTRRAFIRRAGQLSAAGAASTYAFGLAGLSDLSALSAEDGYKALVCVFLYGGNDHANTLVPYDSSNHARYQRIRGSIAIPRTQLAGTVLRPLGEQVLTDDLTYALSPYMPRLKGLFDKGYAAPILNVGPLIAPLTRAQYDTGNVSAHPRPAKLFSHNDQQSTWQASQPEGAASGWGGRMGDLILSANTNSMFTMINATGNAVFLAGETAVPFKVSENGATTVPIVEAGSLHRSNVAARALEEIVRTHHGHVFEQDYSRVLVRSLEYGTFVNDALKANSFSGLSDSESSLANQLGVVARLIASRENLGVTRQVFMVSLGGFDHHTGLLAGHSTLLDELDKGIDAFHRALTALGIADRVTLFTASDFGRTLTSNGDGTDHGWGGHHFVVGNAVNGGRFFGTAPHVSISSDDQVGRGRLLPSTSVDEYSTTLALWMGIPPHELSGIAPNIGRFQSPNLGFMKLD